MGIFDQKIIEVANVLNQLYKTFIINGYNRSLILLMAHFDEIIRLPIIDFFVIDKIKPFDCLSVIETAKPGTD